MSIFPFPAYRIILCQMSPLLLVARALLLAVLALCTNAMRSVHHVSETPGDHFSLPLRSRRLTADPSDLRPFIGAGGLAAAVAALGEGARVVDCTHTITPSTFSFAAHCGFFGGDKVRPFGPDDVWMPNRARNRVVFTQRENSDFAKGYMQSSLQGIVKSTLLLLNPKPQTPKHKPPP